MPEIRNWRWLELKNRQNGAEPHHSHRPYWKRAHHDWRIWVGVILMLAAMFIYLATGDLRWRIQDLPQHPVSGAVGT
jgi:hypothetical protein